MMKKLILFTACIIFLMLAGQVVVAAPYTGWQNEYVGTEPNTLALWHFNSDDYWMHSWNWPHSDEVLSGSVHAARITNTDMPQFGAPGKFGDAFTSTGASTSECVDVIGMANPNDIWPAGADPDLSVEFWIKPQDGQTQSGYIIDRRYTQNNGFQILLDWPTDSSTGTRWQALHASVGDGTAVINVRQDCGWLTGQWYHVAMTWTAADDTLRLYRDGKLLASTTSAGSVLATPAYAIVMANRIGSSYSRLHASVDEVRISDVAYDYIPAALTEVPVENYTGWMDDYDGDNANTLCLWTFNEDTRWHHRWNYEESTDVMNVGTSHSLFLQANQPDTRSVYEAGKFGGGFHCIKGDGSHDNLGTAGGLSTESFPQDADPSITVESWVKLDANALSAGGWQFLVDRQYHSPAGGYMLLFAGANPTMSLTYYMGDGTSLMTVGTGGGTWEADKWYHVAGTWDADDDTLRIYVDGFLVNATAFPGQIPLDVVRTNMVCGRQNWSSPLPSTVDNVRVSDVAYQFQGLVSDSVKDAWDTAGNPDCWTINGYTYQCKGNAADDFDGLDEDGKRKYVNGTDLTVLASAWKKVDNATWDANPTWICADFDRSFDGLDKDGKRKWVTGGDLTILATGWQKVDTDIHFTGTPCNE